MNQFFLKNEELSRIEAKLHHDYRNAIISFLESRGGRYSYIMVFTDEYELSYDDKFPVICTLWGKNYTYNIGITDVYAIKDSTGRYEIYADGIDTDTDKREEGFIIYPEQFSYIAYFITYQQQKQIEDFAGSLALMDLVSANNKIPAELTGDNGKVKEHYHEAYRAFYEKNHKHIIGLIGEVLKARTFEEKSCLNSDIMAYVESLSILSLIQSNNILEDEMSQYNQKEESYSYKEKYQNQYNGNYDEVESQFHQMLGFELE